MIWADFALVDISILKFEFNRSKKGASCTPQINLEVGCLNSVMHKLNPFLRIEQSLLVLMDGYRLSRCLVYKKRLVNIQSAVIAIICIDPRVVTEQQKHRSRAFWALKSLILGILSRVYDYEFWSERSRAEKWSRL